MPTKLLNFRVTEEERADLEKRAAANGSNVSDFVRLWLGFTVRDQKMSGEVIVGTVRLQTDAIRHKGLRRARQVLDLELEGLRESLWKEIVKQL